MLDQTLFPPQQAVLEHGMLDLGFSSVLSLATGSGKTTLAEMAIDRTLQRGERAAYLTPLKALAEEKISSWRERWSDRKVGIFTGDYESSRVDVPYREAEILICTYERLDGILRHWQRHLFWLARLGLVVIDEFHLLTDPTRGPRLEGAISRLRRVNPFCRLMGLSATISNHADLATWLDGVSYHSTWRPVPLKHEVRRFKRLQDKPALIIDIVAETAQARGQTLVFASSRRRAERLAQEITAAGYAASHHHAGLGSERRRSIEHSFREGELTCLVSTPTLEMGLNLPCRTVVIADNTRWNGDRFAPLPVWNYLQRAGRAGRPGQDGSGRAILLVPTWARQVPDYGRILPEPVRSRLGSPSHLAEQILIEIASRSSRTRAQLVGAFLPMTLAYRQDAGLAERFPRCLDELIAAGMIEEDESALLRPTPVGWTSVRHHLSPATTKHLLRLADVELLPRLTDFDLLLHHCWDAELQPQLPLAIEVVELLEDVVQPVPSTLLDAPPPLEIGPRACANGVLMAILAWQYVCAEDAESLCERLDLYLSDAELLRQNLVRLLIASADVHAAARGPSDSADQRWEQLCGPSLPSRLRRLALQLEHGLPGNSVELTRLTGCGGRLARRLFEAGITDLEDLCLQEPTDLGSIPGIGAKRAGSWIAAAEELIKGDEPIVVPHPPAQRRAMSTPADWPREIDPGRLRRAITLRVDPATDGHWVSGGAEEHRVQQDGCDCADFVQRGAGWWCKHRLAVRLARNDPMLTSLANRLSDLRPPPTVAGHLADLALGRRWHDE